MDTFYEQIVSIKKSRKKIVTFVAIWLLALLLCAVVVLMLMSSILGGISILLIAGILYGAFKLSGKLNIEYEYIITNGTFDIDKIINKSARKRIASFELSITNRLEKFNEGLLNNVDQKDVVYACNTDSENAYLLVYQKEGKKAVYVVFEPNEKIKTAVVKFLPKFIANSAFK